VHVLRGALSNIFKGVLAFRLGFFFEKYFVFATPSKPFWGILMEFGTKKITV
jgi:hypothetical protein